MNSPVSPEDEGCTVLPNERDMIQVVALFDGRSFSTLEFVDSFKTRFALEWQGLESRYGTGGAGAGTHYSAYSRIAHALNNLANNELIEKLDYRPAPLGWGSPKIRYWTLSTKERGGYQLPEEIGCHDEVYEGAKTTVLVNKYERSPIARAQCIEAWGLCCVACGFDFEAVYGERGAGYIHVHHLTPLSEIGDSYKVDPKEDLRPVCPNCHAMIHRTKELTSIEELKAILKLNRTRQ